MTHFARQSLFGTGAESGARYMEPKWLTFESKVLRKKAATVAITATDVAAAADNTNHIKNAGNNMNSNISSNSLMYLNRSRTSTGVQIIRALSASPGLGIERLGSI